MPATPGPTQLKLRVYQVGFGDCFLLTFNYPAQADRPAFARHVLIDLGSGKAPKAFGAGLLNRVADDIKKECGGKLHVIIATHRHRDHINGFATQANGKGPGDVIRSCQPNVVLQPWTEDPAAKADARTPTRTLAPEHAFIRGLTAMHEFAAGALAEAARLRGAIGKKRQERLAFLGETGLADLSAVQNLMKMGRKHQYLYFGCDAGLDAILPGVETHVLGPPTLAQSVEIAKERREDEAEFWRLLGLTGTQFLSPGKSPFARAAVQRTFPPYARWIIPRLQAVRGGELMELVRILDSAMNNTSLILAFETGGKIFLFPGDAQIEDWSYALEQAAKKPSLRRLLQEAVLYKVGHHGSRNATPRSGLWRMFKHRGAKGSRQRLQTILSTMAGPYSEVPCNSLLDALKKESDFFSTQALKRKTELKTVFEIPL